MFMISNPNKPNRTFHHKFNIRDHHLSAVIKNTFTTQRNLLANIKNLRLIMREYKSSSAIILKKTVPHLMSPQRLFQ